MTKVSLLRATFVVGFLAVVVLKKTYREVILPFQARMQSVEYQATALRGGHVAEPLAEYEIDPTEEQTASESADELLKSGLERNVQEPLEMTGPANNANGRDDAHKRANDLDMETLEPQKEDPQTQMQLSGNDFQLKSTLEVTETSTFKKISEQNSMHPAYAIPLVVRASGEMGNHLMKILHAKTVGIVARDAYNMPTRIAMRLENLFEKFEASRSVLNGCFPNVDEHVDYGKDLEKMREEYLKRIDQQETWLGKQLAGKLVIKGAPSVSEIRNLLLPIKRIVEDMRADRKSADRMCNQTIQIDGEETTVQYTCLPPNVMDNQSTFELPFIIVNDFPNLEDMDVHYEELREFLFYNDSAAMPDGSGCCALSPDPDETVFHFRNFVTEMNGFQGAGFRELDPNRTAYELLGDLQPGVDRVAITTRFDNDRAREYVHALQRRNISTRVVSGQQPFQDFCFLKRAKRRLVGSAMSTFAIYAGMLSNDRTLPVYKYSVNNGGWPREHNRTWAHPELRERIHFQLFEE